MSRHRLQTQFHLACLDEEVLHQLWKRAVRGSRIVRDFPRETEETEKWHAPEEAELRTKVLWEPDEALTKRVGRAVLLFRINVYPVFLENYR